MDKILRGLTQDGVLRVAINTGNRALVQQNDGKLAGICPALARRLADELEAKLDCVMYSGAGKVFVDAERQKWDLAFLAIDPMRAKKVSFTRPYVTIEATYAVRADSKIGRIDDVDQEGVSVLTSTGSAYDMFLTKSLRYAQLQRSGTPPDSFKEFSEGRCDAVAGVRQSLEKSFGNNPAYKILSGVLTKVDQAMALPGPDNPKIEALDQFLDRAIEDGFVEANFSNDSN